jgi:hypothetical protein
MRQPKGVVEYGKEGCCPDEWNHVPNMTGSFELDGAIMKCKNGDAQRKLCDCIASGGSAYKIGNGYAQSAID